MRRVPTPEGFALPVHAVLILTGGDMVEFLAHLPDVTCVPRLKGRSSNIGIPENGSDAVVDPPLDIKRVPAEYQKRAYRG